MSCELFTFASAPRTATTWLCQAAAEAGLPLGGSKHVPHDKHCAKIRLSLVRHPCTWLRSYYSAIWPGATQVGCVDGLRSACLGAENFSAFVRAYLASGWRIGDMFDAYGADVVIRVEDLPWAFVEFLESLEIPRSRWSRILKLGRPNASEKQPAWSPSLRDAVFEVELDWSDRHGYFW